MPRGKRGGGGGGGSHRQQQRGRDRDRASSYANDWATGNYDSSRHEGGSDDEGEGA